jgi:branched-chain amino acid transport system ATP-binding protein
MSDVLVQFGGLRAVDEVSLEVREGQVVGLIGPNGAGKTTFIDAATGFVPAGGEIVFGGESLSELPAHQRARRGLVRTWQSMEIFDDLTIAENLRVAGERTTLKSVLLDVVAPGRAADVTQVEWALELMGLEHLADARPADLTLGQRKLLGVGRALASRPNLVMLDEPAAGLDDGESAALGDRIRDVTRHGISVFLVDHDMGLVLDVCDYIYVLDFGQLIAQGTSDEIRQDPRVITAYLGEEVEA